MPKLSVNQLSGLTGKTRATVNKALDAVTPEIGEKSAKLYDSKIALEIIYGARGGASGGEEGYISNQEANRLLTLERRAEIQLDIEIKRKERIPLDVVSQINDEVFSGAAAIIKGHLGKKLTSVVIKDILALFRDIPGRLKW